MKGGQTFKYHTVMPFLAKLPQQLAYRLVSLYSKFQKESNQEEREVICNQMRHIFVGQSDKQLNEWVDYFFSMLEREKLDVEFFQTLQTEKEIDSFVRFHQHEELLQARKQGRRVLLTTGHFGRLWMVGVGLQRHGISMGTITRDSNTENTRQLADVEFQYQAYKLRVLQQRFKGPFLVEGGSVRPIYRVLDKHVVTLLIDVPYEGEKNGCIELPFLGKTARFPLGIAKIARKTNALIIPYYVNESRAGLDLDFFPAIEAADFDEIDIMRQLVLLLEKKILSNPEQWWLWAALPMMWQS